MEGLWARCAKCERIADAGGEPIQESHKLRIMLKVLTGTGLFSLDIRDWNKRQAPLVNDWTNFKLFFANANRERCANMTAGDYRHQAHSAHGGTRSGATSPTFSEITQASLGTNGSVNLSAMKYCWTHGFYPNGNGHTSRECNYKKNGHQEDATFVDMKGGNNTIRRKPGETNDFGRLNNETTDTTNDGDQPPNRRRGRRKRGQQANLTNQNGTDSTMTTNTTTTNNQDVVNAVAQQVLAQITGQGPDE
jgi:hypothetical protein